MTNVKKIQKIGSIHDLCFYQSHQKGKIRKKSANRPDTGISQIIDTESF